MNQDFRVSYNALRKIYSQEAYSNIAMNEALEDGKNCSPGFVRYVVKEILRRSMALDYVIAGLCRNGLRGMKSRTKVLLRMGIFLLNEVDSIPDAVCVNEIVELAGAVDRPNRGFINGVLRSYLRGGKKMNLPGGSDRHALAVRYSCQENLVKLMLDQYGSEEGVRILDAFNRPVPVALRNNPLKQDRETLLQQLRELEIEGTPSAECDSGILTEGGALIQNDLFRKGHYSVQGISSQMAIQALAPKAGSKVLDMCAAPGGKTTGIAELMRDCGTVEAWDIHPHRTELIRRNAERLGLHSVETAVKDATVFYPELEGCYDAVVADVPCSGLGTIPVKPEIKLRDHTGEYAGLVKIQRRILENAWKYVKPGGRVMYSTCTINKEENEKVVEAFQKSMPDSRVIEKRLILPYNKTGFFYTVLEKPE